MAHLYHKLGYDNRRCRCCNRPCKLFGQLDIETRWFGWCVICNHDWKHMFEVRRYLCCSRGCNVKEPFQMGALRYSKVNLARLILSYFSQVSGAFIHSAIIFEHKRTLDKILWTNSRLDWFLADDSDDEFSLDDPLILASLRHECVSAVACRMCYRQLDNAQYAAMGRYTNKGVTLLDLIYSYLYPAPGETLMRAGERWNMFSCHGRCWLWNSVDSAENFFVDAPPPYWRRYYYIVSYPRHAAFWWSHRNGRWFVEPTSLSDNSTYSMESLRRVSNSIPRRLLA